MLKRILTVIVAFSVGVALAQLPPSNGGTGQSNPAPGQLLLTNGSNPFFLIRHDDNTQTFVLTWPAAAPYPSWEIPAASFDANGPQFGVAYIDDGNTVLATSKFTYDPNLPRVQILSGNPSLPTYNNNDVLVVAHDANGPDGGNTSLNITAASTKNAGIVFSDELSRILGKIYYVFSENSLYIGTNDIVRMVLDANTIEIRNSPSLTLPEQASAPANPGTGTGSYFFGTDGRPYAINSSGMVMPLGAAPESSNVSFVGEQVLTATATSITIGNLDLTRDQIYKAFVSIKTSASAGTISLYANGDTTATNYYVQNVSGSSSTASAGNANTGVIQGAINSIDAIYEITFQMDVSGKPRAICSRNVNNTTNLNTALTSWYRTTAANLTSITIQSSVASDLQIGSYVRVYKVGPPNTVPAANTGAMQLVQEQQVSGSAVTSVTFSNLDLNRDSLYFVRYAINSASGSNSDIRIQFENDANDPDYTKQWVLFDNATTTPARSSDSIFSVLPGNSTVEGTAYIQKSGNGAPTWSSSTNELGSTRRKRDATVYRGLSAFSTFKVVSSVASAIAVGSKFQLYRISSSAPAISGPVPSDMEGVKFVYTDPNTITLTPSGPDGKAYVHVVDTYNNELMVSLSSSLTANMAASGCGGRAAGTDSASTGFYVWLWTQASGLSPCLTYDTSATSPTTPTNGVFKRLVWFVRNDASANIAEFTWAGPWKCIYVNRQNIVSNGIASTKTAIDHTGYIPVKTCIVYASALAENQSATVRDMDLFLNSTSNNMINFLWNATAAQGVGLQENQFRYQFQGTLSTGSYYQWFPSSPTAGQGLDYWADGWEMCPT